MSGPSTLALSDMNQNKHVWIQKLTHLLRLTNPCNYPVKVEVFMIKLKCDDAGQTPGVFVEPTIPFATGSATAAANQPISQYWEFFDQSSRQPMTTSGSVTAASWQNDHILSHNTGGTYDAPQGDTTNTFWEIAMNSYQGMRWDENTPLSFIFPNLRRKAKLKRVFKRTLMPLQTKQVKIRESFPRELRPRDYISDSKTNFSKHSYCLFMRARAIGYVPETSDWKTGSDPQQYPIDTFNSPWVELPAQVVVNEMRRISVRRSGDAFPTFARADINSAAWINYGGLWGPRVQNFGGIQNTITGVDTATKRWGEIQAPRCAGGLLDTTAGVDSRVFKLN